MIASEAERGGEGSGVREISAIRVVEAKGRGGHSAPTCEIELGGEAWTHVDAEVVVRLGLHRGQRLGPDDCERVLQADQVLRARRWAAARCASRPRPRRILEQELHARKFGASAIAEALDGLEASGTLDDLEAGARHLRKRRRGGGYGPNRLRNELIAHGLSRETAEAALAKDAAGDSLEDCLELARKRAKRYEPLRDARNRVRLMQFLQRRGFDAEIIHRVMERLGAGDD